MLGSEGLTTGKSKWTSNQTVTKISTPFLLSPSKLTLDSIENFNCSCKNVTHCHQKESFSRHLQSQATWQSASVTFLQVKPSQLRQLRLSYNSETVTHTV